MPDNNIPSGVNNHRNHKSDFGKDHLNMLSRLVSIHESYHTNLNISSAYGLLLLVYSQAAQNALKDRDKFASIFRAVMANCSYTHEWCSTFCSMMIMLAEGHVASPEEMLEHFPNYTIYYETAEALVSGIPGYHLKQLVILMATGAVMQGKTVAEAVLRSPAGFSLSSVRTADLPDNRLKNIRQKFSAADIRRLAEDFLSTGPGTKYAGFVRHELDFARQPAYLSSPVFLDVTQAISEYFYEVFKIFFDNQGLPTYGFDDHLWYREQITTSLKDYFDAAASEDFFNISPYDLERSSLATLESEAVILAGRPRQCQILFPHQVHEGLRKMILAGDALGNAVLMFRHSLGIRKQYEFRETVHSAWLGKEARTVVFFRTLVKMHGQEVIIMIPFDSPGMLTDFLKGRPAGIKLIGCFSSTAFEDKEWAKTSAPQITGILDDIYFLNDESLISYLDQIKDDDNLEHLFYIMPVEIGEIKAACLLTRTRSADGLEKIMVAPGGTAFISAAEHYITKRVPFLYRENFVEAGLAKAIHSILWSVYSQETEWYYWLARL